MPRPAPIRVLAGWPNRYRADTVDPDAKRRASLASWSAQSLAVPVSFSPIGFGRSAAARASSNGAATAAHQRRNTYGFRRSGLSGRRNEHYAQTTQQTKVSLDRRHRSREHGDRVNRVRRACASGPRHRRVRTGRQCRQRRSCRRRLGQRLSPGRADDLSERLQHDGCYGGLVYQRRRSQRHHLHRRRFQGPVGRLQLAVEERAGRSAGQGQSAEQLCRALFDPKEQHVPGCGRRNKLRTALLRLGPPRQQR